MGRSKESVETRQKTFSLFFPLSKKITLGQKNLTLIATIFIRHNIEKVHSFGRSLQPISFQQTQLVWKDFVIVLINMKVAEKEGKGETDGRVRGFYFFQEEVEKIKKGTQQHNVEKIVTPKNKCHRIPLTLREKKGRKQQNLFI